MGHGQRSRQVVFRNDGAGGFAFGARQCLERKFIFGIVTRIDASKPFSDRFRIDAASAVARNSAGEYLRFQRRAAGGVERYTLEHLDPFSRGVIGPHDTLESMAAVAAQQKSLLLLCAWNA